MWCGVVRCGEVRCVLVPLYWFVAESMDGPHSVIDNVYLYIASSVC